VGNAEFLRFGTREPREDGREDKVRGDVAVKGQLYASKRFWEGVSGCEGGRRASKHMHLACVVGDRSSRSDT